MELYNHPTVALFYLPALVLAIATEAILYTRQNGHYPWRDAVPSLLIAIGHSLSGVINYTVITTGVALALWQVRLMTVDMSRWFNIVLLLLLVEFCYYWYHRAAHRIRLLWASHSVHHSPEELTLTAAYRLSWTPILSGSWLFFLPLVWLGFDPLWVFGTLSTSLLYQFWLHTTLIPKLGPLEWVLNTPSAHRVHHASNAEYLDRNYGGILIIFDRLFGTYVAEDAAIKIRFGLVHPIRSRNPLVILFNEFAAMLRDVWHAKTWGERAGRIFAPPSWQPSGPDAPPTHKEVV